MADPLTGIGAVAAIQQLVVAAGEIIRYCYGYSQKYRHANIKIGQLAQELRGLVHILSELKTVLLEGGDRTTSLKSLEPLINDVGVEVSQILIELPQGKLGHRQRMLWPFTEDRTTELVDIVSKKLAALHVAIGLENLRINEKSWTYVAALQRSFTAWTIRLDHANQDQLRSKILKWISFNHLPLLRIQERHEDRRSIRHPTAGINTLTHDLFLGWKSQQFYGQNSWLWIIGEAGTRKSIVMSVLVDDLLSSCQETTTEVAVLYCQYELTNPVIEQTVTHILGSLTSQLLRRCSPLPHLLVAVYTEQADHGEPSLNLATDIFIAAVQALGSCYLVVDGLDELSSTVRPALLDVFDRLAQERVKLLISTRPHLFELKAVSEQSLVINIRPEKAEIASYLTDEIANNEKLQVKIKGDSTTAAYLVEEISSRAGDSFTFAVAMLGTIQAGISKAQVIKLMGSSQTAGDVFGSTMKRILQQPEKEDALKILGWLTYARTSMTLKQLQVAMAVTDRGGFDEDSIPVREIILEICSGLVQIEPSSGIVRLVHLTARDFLVEQAELNSLSVERQLAQTCIHYLMGPSFAKLCVTNDEIAKRQTENEFTMYAISYWATHALAAQEDNLTETILSFALQPNASSVFQLTPPHHMNLQTRLPSSYGYMYWPSLCHEPVTASYFCAFFKLAKSQEALSLIAPELLEQSITWGNEFSPLHSAVWQQDIDTAKVLLKHKVNIIHRDILGATPAHLAVIFNTQSQIGKNEFLSMILEADEGNTARDLADHAGRTPLHYAVLVGPVSAVRSLSEKNYDPNARDKSGNTSLHYYAGTSILKDSFQSRNEILRILLSHGANPTLTNEIGESALSMVTAQNRIDDIVTIREALDPNTGLPYNFSSHDIEASDQIYQKTIDDQLEGRASADKDQLATQREQQVVKALEKLMRKQDVGSKA